MKCYFGGKSGSRRHSTTGFGTKLSNVRRFNLLQKEVNSDLLNLTLLLNTPLFYYNCSSPKLKKSGNYMLAGRTLKEVILKVPDDQLLLVLAVRASELLPFFGEGSATARLIYFHLL